MARPRTFRLEAKHNGREVAEAILGVGRDAEFALASALRATANAAKTETQKELAADAGIARIAYRRRVLAYLRKRGAGRIESRVWVGAKVHLRPRHHPSIEQKALTLGYRPESANRTRISRRGDYVRKGPSGKLEIFSLDLDRPDTQDMLQTAARHHLRTTFRIYLAREMDRRLARRGGHGLARTSIGAHEARMRRLLGEIR